MLPNSTPSYVALSNSLIVPSIVSIVSVTLPASSNLMLSLSTPSTNSLAEFVTIVAFDTLNAGIPKVVSQTPTKLSSFVGFVLKYAFKSA